VSILVSRDHALRRLEQQTIDARFQIRGTDRTLIAGIVIVPIDQTTFNDFAAQHLADRWPFPRRYDARVIDRLHRAGASVIAVDIQFTEPSDTLDDNALIEAIARARNVVLSTTDVGPHGTTNVLGGDSVLRSVGARAGDTSLFLDSDGTIRNTQYSILGLTTFPVVVAGLATRHRVPVSLFGGVHTQVPIDYAGPPGTVPAIPFSRVYDGRFPRRMVAGKIVIVGASDSTLGDVHVTPTSGTEMSGPELLANMTGSVLHRLPLRYSPSWATTLLIALLALSVSLAGLRLGTIGVALTGLGALLIWSIATQLVFDAGTIVDYADPTASLFLATSGTMGIGLLADSRERRRLRNLFAADAGGVVEQVLQGPSGHRPIEPTAIIAGYRIESPIGRGGMGVVYRASQLALERPVAIKLIAAERAQDPVFRDRFKLESRLAAAIEHVNVIPVYEAGEDDGLLFIAMRLVEGSDLAEHLGRVKTLEPTRAARLVSQLAAAIDAAHAHGLVHRDIKPANILLTFDRPEHLYLTDFGVAKHVGAGDGMTMAGQWVGTLDYLAPEQIRGDPVGVSADIYSLAGLLHHCLTGQVPYPRDNDVAKLWAHVNAPPPAPSRLVGGLPAAIDEVIARGMAKDPADRFPTAIDLAHHCSEALGVPTPVRIAEPGPVESELRPLSGESAPTAISE
jgi:serine/threonine protein kinase/CHASE2 domain-containing sensor protein